MESVYLRIGILDMGFNGYDGLRREWKDSEVGWLSGWNMLMMFVMESLMEIGYEEINYERFFEYIFVNF